MEHKDKIQFKCEGCGSSMRELLAEIPAWYFQTRGPIVCPKCGRQHDYTDEYFAEARRIKIADFNSRNPEFRDGVSGFVPKKGKYRYKG